MKRALAALAVAAGATVFAWMWWSGGGSGTAERAQPELPSALSESLPDPDRQEIDNHVGDIGVRGAVVSRSSGTPIAGALVFVDDLPPVTADAAGQFSVPGVPVGRHMVRATAPGFAPPRPSEPPAVEVDVADGAAAVVTLELVPSVRVQGIVVAGDSPVRGATFSVYYEPAPGQDELVWEASIQSDGEGRFRLADLWPGRLRLLVESPTGDLAESPTFALRPGESRDGVRIDLAAAARVEGTVADAGGAVLGDATVRLWAEGQRPREARTDEQGRFEFSELAPGEYTLRASRGGFRPSQVDGIRLEPGDVWPAVRLVLTPEPGLLGLVVDSAGKPAGGATVHWSELDGELGGTVAADGQGRFWIADAELAAARRVTLVATHPRWAPSEPLDVAADFRAPLELRLMPGGTVEGLVVDADTGQPVAGAEVGVVRFRQAPGDAGQRRGRAGHVRTDAGGRFRLEGLAPGDYALSAKARDYAASTSPWSSVSAGMTTSGVRLSLSRGGAVLGFVADASGHAIAGATVRMDTLVGEGYSRDDVTAMTDRQGRFRVGGLPPGPRSVSVTHGGFNGRTLSGVMVEAGRETKMGMITLDKLKEGERPSTTYTGIGTVLREDGGRFLVGKVIGGGAAEEAGVREGTEILAVDGLSVRSLSLAEIVERIRGEERSSVELLVQSPGGGPPEILSMMRSSVSSPR